MAQDRAGGPARAGETSMLPSQRALGAGCFVLALAILLAPALWNGFPLLQWDSGGYIARAFEPYLVPSRSVVYGYFAAAGWPLNYWPVVLVQAAATAFVIGLALRAFDLDARPLLLPAIVLALSIVTTLPLIAGAILTDIFAGISVVGLHLLVFEADRLDTLERFLLTLLIAFAAASHSATLTVLAGLLALGLAVWLLARAAVPGAGLARGAVAVAFGVALLLAGNHAVTRRLTWTPGGSGILFGRMLQAGIVHRYLADHCPDPGLRLCAHRDEIPQNADEFLWGQGVFDRLGRFEGLGDEMATIVRGALRDYPLLQIRAAAEATAAQFVKVASGEGVLNSIWHTYAIIERDTPRALPAMRAARQQRGEIGFETINRLHVPVALLSIALLPGLIWLGVARPAYGDLAALGTTVAAALLLNAFVCGALANPHDRYGARMVWVASFAILLASCRWLKQRAPQGAAAMPHGTG